MANVAIIAVDLGQSEIEREAEMRIGSSHFKNVGFKEGALEVMKENIEFVVQIVENEEIFSE